MPEILQGVQLELSGKELADHLAGRAAFHELRKQFYVAQGSALAAGAPELFQNEQPTYGGAVDPAHQLGLKVREHQKKAGLFHFMAEHVRLDAIYRITEQDLLRLEFLE